MMGEEGIRPTKHANGPNTEALFASFVSFVGPSFTVPNDLRHSMKTLLLVPFLLCTSLILSARGEDRALVNGELTAKELAYHLGITSWTSALRLGGSDHKVEILRVLGGVVVSTALSTNASATDRELTRVVICVGPTATGSRLSLQIAAAPSSSVALDAVSTQLIIALPKTLAEGDYVLGGTLRASAEKRNPDELTAADLLDGLLLRVSKQP